MKQIKTIATKLDATEAFNERVNAALAEGWTLVRREVLEGSPHDHAALFAELEREVYGKNDPKECKHCKHKNTLFVPDSPCPKCKNYEKWELSEKFADGNNAKKEDAKT